MAPDEKARVLAELEVCGEMRDYAHALLAAANDCARGLVPGARDAGATVQEIADRLKVTRAAVYDLMRRGDRDDA